MEPLLQSGTCSSQVLAATLLDAWLSGDRYRLTWVLEQMSALPQLPGDGAECDRMEILTSIAGEMRAHSDLFTLRAANPRVGAWMNLLDHFSGREQVTPN